MKTSIWNIISTTATVFSIILVMLVSVTTVLYYYEGSKRVGDYFEWYGTVTTKTEYVYPEDIRSYAFGYSDRDDLTMNFVGELWCRELDSRDNYTLVTSKFATQENYKFVNDTTASGTAPIQDDRSISLIGIRQQLAVRAAAEEQQYVSWPMETHPLASSECFIISNVGTATDIFGIEKQLRFEGNKFTYIIPEGVNPE